MIVSTVNFSVCCFMFCRFWCTATSWQWSTHAWAISECISNNHKGYTIHFVKMYIDTLTINYRAKCERCVPFVLHTDRVYANLKQDVKLVCWVFKTLWKMKCTISLNYRTIILMLVSFQVFRVSVAQMHLLIITSNRITSLLCHS